MFRSIFTLGLLGALSLQSNNPRFLNIWKNLVVELAGDLRETVFWGQGELLCILFPVLGFFFNPQHHTLDKWTHLCLC